jgi:hypothetical protein
VLLIAFDTLAAVGSFTVAMVLLAFPGSLERNSIDRGDWSIIALECAQVAVVAALLAVPYGRWVSRAERRVSLRAICSGPLYAIAVIAGFLGLALILPVGDRTPQPSSFLGVLPIYVILGAPFWLLGGLAFGAVHGVVAARLARASAIAPIVTV